MKFYSQGGFVDFLNQSGFSRLSLRSEFKDQGVRDFDDLIPNEVYHAVAKSESEKGIRRLENFKANMALGCEQKVTLYLTFKYIDIETRVVELFIS